MILFDLAVIVVDLAALDGKRARPAHVSNIKVGRALVLRRDAHVVHNEVV